MYDYVHGPTFFLFWSFDRRPFLMMRLRVKKVGFSEIRAFQLGMRGMHTFQLKMHKFHFDMRKTADFGSNLLISWELVTGGYRGRPVKCVHFETPYQAW